MKFKELLDQVRQRASGRWEEVIQAVAKVSPLPIRKNLPCPKCGGNDRFHKTSDFKTSGALRCRKCPEASNCADGVGSVAWITGQTQQESLEAIAEYLGIEFKKSKPKAKITFDHVVINQESPFGIKNMIKGFVDDFVKKKEGITKDGLKRCGIKFGKINFGWNHQNNKDWVIAFPRLNKDGDEKSFVMMPADGTKFNFRGAGVNKCQTSKVANGEGFSGSHEGEIVFIVEGETDLAALYSAMPLGSKYSALTIGGASVKPIGWLIDRLSEKSVYVVYDQDENEQGQKGALLQCRELCNRGKDITVKNVVLDETNTDLRSWLSKPGNSFKHLIKLCDSTDPFELDEKTEKIVSIGELDDYDPKRLALINIAQYSEGGRRLVYWNDTWYRYKQDHYEAILDHELKTKLRGFLEDEFMSIWKLEVDNWDNPKSEPPKAPRPVLSKIVNEVIESMKVQCLAKTGISFPGWLDDPMKSTGNLIPLKNGLLDINKLIDGYDESKDPKEFLMPHTSDFFSSVCLTYKFEGVDEMIDGTNFGQVLRFAFPGAEGVKSRIVLQQFVGYLLSQDNTYNKFLLMTGQGGNGKSVFLTVIKALLGAENVASSPLDQIADRFEASAYYDKLVNIIDEASPKIEQRTLNHLKRLTGGGDVRVEQKGKKPFFQANKCRFIITCNQIPQFQDLSDATGRRMLLIEWERQVPEKDQNPDYLDENFWKQSGELPIIFAWALQGLIDLRRHKKFQVAEELKQKAYEASQSSVEEDWLGDHLAETGSKMDFIFTEDLGKSYFGYAKKRSVKTKFESNPHLIRWIKTKFKDAENGARKVDGKVKRGLFGICWKDDAWIPEDEI